MTRSILVTGDVVLDLNLYGGRRRTPMSPEKSGMRSIHSPGGAMLTFRLLDALRRCSIPPNTAKPDVVVPDLSFGLKETTEKALRTWPSQFEVGAVWEQYEGPKRGEAIWRLSQDLGYGPVQSGDYPAHPAPGLEAARPDILVIDDGAMGFRLQTAAHCWPDVVKDGRGDHEPEWVVLKMSSPLGRGDLWRTLSQRFRDRLVVVVTADNLRREDAQVARGSSWERTADDIVEEIRSNPTMREFRECRHLLVTLRGDAAVWLDQPGDGQYTCKLVFDRERGEGEWEDGLRQGDAYGYHSAVTASVAWGLAAAPEGAAGPDLASPLRAGLSASRFLREYGHGPVGTGEGEPGFPFELAAREILRPAHDYAVADVPCSGASDVSPRWTILRESGHSDVFPGPLYGPARRFALVGPAALSGVPCARFGKLFTMDRREIEALRSLRQLMLAYRRSGPQKQPLSIAVFGAPGSGKSFGLKQIAQGVFGDDNEVLEFNLSQFAGPQDLIGAYHQVRDSVLAGKTPVVFWDEFDSRDCFWLQYLLAPMQDGLFQEGQLTHSIGKCVFVFAGGTSRDFAHFGPPEDAAPDEEEPQRRARAEFVMAKGPDFKSRLAGFLDVLGPNPGQVYNEVKAGAGLGPWEDDPSDVEFPVRRAVLLRALLGLVKGAEGKPLEIDKGLLTALLEIGHYRHGARSMEKLISQMRDRGGLPLRRASLPPDDLLALYVDDVEHFKALVRRPHRFLAQAERLAPIFHEDWRASLSPEGQGNPNNVPYEELTPEKQAANVAAAIRMPEILALAGFTLVEGAATKREEAAVVSFLDEHKETLAEAEHDGWADQQRLEGWSPGDVRDDEARVHDLLVPYAELSEEEKQKDRRTVDDYTKYARSAGFKVVPVAAAGD